MSSSIKLLPKRIFLFVVTVLATVVWVKAQVPTYKLYLSNEEQTAPNEYEFDVYLLREGTVPLEMSTFQFGLGFDTSILNGGTPLASIITGSSDFPPNFVPTTVEIGALGYFVNGIIYRYFNCAARSALGSGPYISDSTMGCLDPGMRLARFRLTNSIPFDTNSTCKHVWSTSSGNGRTNTLLNAYISGVSTNISNGVQAQSNLDYNVAGTCIQNIVLNPGLTNAGQLTDEIYLNRLIIYPNPSHNEITIASTTDNVNDFFTSFSVNNSFGQEVYRESEIERSQISLNIGFLPSGIYYIKISRGEGLFIRKLIKTD